MSNFNVEKTFDFVRTNQRWNMMLIQRWSMTLKQRWNLTLFQLWNLTWFQRWNLPLFQRWNLTLKQHWKCVVYPTLKSITLYQRWKLVVQRRDLKSTLKQRWNNSVALNMFLPLARSKSLWSRRLTFYWTVNGYLHVICTYMQGQYLNDAFYLQHPALLIYLNPKF